MFRNPWYDRPARTDQEYGDANRLVRLPVVQVRPGYLSGKPALRDDLRVPPETIVDNIDAGETAEQVIENFGLRTPLQDVLAVYAHAKKQHAKSPV